MGEIPKYSEQDIEADDAPKQYSRRDFLRLGATLAGATIIGVGLEGEARADEAVSSIAQTEFLRSSLDPIKFETTKPLPEELENLVDEIMIAQRNIDTTLQSIATANLDSAETKNLLAGAEQTKRSLWEKINQHFRYGESYSEQNYSRALIYDTPRLLAPYGIATFIRPIMLNDAQRSKFIFSTPILSLYTIKDIQSYRVEGGDSSVPTVDIAGSNIYPGSPPFTVGGDMPAAMAMYGNIFTNADGADHSFDYLAANIEKAKAADQSQMEARGLAYVASNSNQVDAALIVAKTFLFKVISQTEVTKSDVLDPLLTHEAGHIANTAWSKQLIPELTVDSRESIDKLENINIRSEIAARLYGLRHTRRRDIEMTGLLEECQTHNDSASVLVGKISAGWVIDQLVAEVVKDQSLINPKFKDSRVQVGAQAILSLPALLADRVRLNQILDRMIADRVADKIDLSKYLAKPDKAQPIAGPDRIPQSQPREAPPSKPPTSTIAVGVGAGLAAAGLYKLIQMRKIGPLETGLQAELGKSLNRRRVDELITDLDLRGRQKNPEKRERAKMKLVELAQNNPDLEKYIRKIGE